MLEALKKKLGYAAGKPDKKKPTNSFSQKSIEASNGMAVVRRKFDLLNTGGYMAPEDNMAQMTYTTSEPAPIYDDGSADNDNMNMPVNHDNMIPKLSHRERMVIGLRRLFGKNANMSTGYNGNYKRSKKVPFYDEVYPDDTDNTNLMATGSLMASGNMPQMMFNPMASGNMPQMMLNPMTPYNMPQMMLNPMAPYNMPQMMLNPMAPYNMPQMMLNPMTPYNMPQMMLNPMAPYNMPQMMLNPMAPYNMP